MKIVARWLGAIRSSLTWSTLAIFGNSPITKLVALAPIVAYVATLQQSFLENYVNFEQWNWFYWSLILVAAGQALFFVFCPRTIKKYGDDIERFSIDCLTTYPLQRTRSLFSQRIRAMQQTGDLALWLDSETEGFNQRLLVELNRGGRSYRIQDIGVHHANYRCLWRMVMLADDDRVPSINFPAMLDMMNDAPQLFKKGATQAPQELREVVGDYCKLAQVPEKNWQLNTYEWKYHFDNNRNRWAIWLVAGLYSTGSVYFAWRFLVGLGEMFSATMLAMTLGVK